MSMARAVNHAARHRRSKKRGVDTAVSVNLHDVCREFLVDIGLLAQVLSALPPVRDVATLNTAAATAEEGSDRDCDELSNASEDDNGLEIDGTEGFDQRELGTFGCIPCAVGGEVSGNGGSVGGGVDLDILSEAISDGALKTFCGLAMSHVRSRTQILCVRDENDGERFRNRVYSMPE